MEIKDMTIEQVIERRNAINQELNGDITLEQIESLENEVTQLEQREAFIKESVEKRNQLINRVINTNEGNVLEARKQGDDKMETKVFTIESQEYRSAYLNNLRGIELNETEKRAFTTVAGSAEAVIPTETRNRILEVIKQEAPLLAEINLLAVPGGVRLPVEDVVNTAIKHAENATITASADKLKYVDMFGYEVVKLLQISKSVMKMSVSAFETWLVNNLGKSLASFITASIIDGSGTGEAKGFNKITWNSSNSISVALAGSLTGANVTGLIALLPGGFDARAKFLMSKKTLFTDFMPLKDAGKNDLVTREGSRYFIYGYPVMLDERVTFHEAFLGDFTQYYGNLPEGVSVVSDFDLNTNSFKYLGSAIFDGKPAIESAFVKLIKATV